MVILLVLFFLLYTIIGNLCPYFLLLNCCYLPYNHTQYLENGSKIKYLKFMLVISNLVYGIMQYKNV